MSKADAGTILVDGSRARIDSPARAQALGIATVFQGLALCENLDVVKNLFLAREIGSLLPRRPGRDRAPAARADRVRLPLGAGRAPSRDTDGGGQPRGRLPACGS